MLQIIKCHRKKKSNDCITELKAFWVVTLPAQEQMDPKPRHFEEGHKSCNGQRGQNANHIWGIGQMARGPQL